MEPRAERLLWDHGRVRGCLKTASALWVLAACVAGPGRWFADAVGSLRGFFGVRFSVYFTSVFLFQRRLSQLGSLGACQCPVEHPQLGCLEGPVPSPSGCPLSRRSARSIGCGSWER